MCPEALKKFERVDTMLITHGHFDHIADAVELGKKFKPQIVGIYETCAWLESKGVQNTSAMNKGGTQKVGEIEVTMVNAVHSCGITGRRQDCLWRRSLRLHHPPARRVHSLSRGRHSAFSET